MFRHAAFQYLLDLSLLSIIAPLWSHLQENLTDFKAYFKFKVVDSAKVAFHNSSTGSWPD